MMQGLYKIRLNKGDTVVVRSGKYKGRTGKILATHPTTNKVTIEGINIVKRHRKPTQARPQGGIDEITKPMDVSKVGYLDSASKKPTRISYKIDGKGKKTRVLKSTGKEVK